MRERFTWTTACRPQYKKCLYGYTEDDLIYRGKRLVNWDPNSTTAISDLEVENKDKKGHMWHLRYPPADGAKTADGQRLFSCCYDSTQKLCW